MTPKAIVAALEIRIGTIGAPEKLIIAVEQELLDEGFSNAEAAETSEKLLPRVTKEVIARQNVAEAAGEVSILALRGANQDVVHGSCFIFQDDSPETRSELPPGNRTVTEATI
jgi:hypothetical protein